MRSGMMPENTGSLASVPLGITYGRLLVFFAQNVKSLTHDLLKRKF